ncbi:MAG: pilin [Firmicutes bacterium]|nr:pilin [Bacillota bacterium]
MRWTVIRRHPSNNQPPVDGEQDDVQPTRFHRFILKYGSAVPTVFVGALMMSHATYAASGVTNVTPVSVSSNITTALTWITGILSTALGGYAAIHFFMHSGRLMAGAHNPQKRQLAIEGFGWTGFAAVIGFGITIVLGILDGFAKHL